MKRVKGILLAFALLAASVSAQEVASRAWQQRLHAEIPVPVPMVTLDPANPFATPVDSPPQLLGGTAPRKLTVSGRATVAAYVDTKGECRGVVPIDLPFPGLTSVLVNELREARFEPARSGSAPKPSWAVIAITMTGKVKESVVVDQAFELPDPSYPEEPKHPPRMSPSGNLANLPATPSDQLSAPATPRRLNIKVPGRDADVVLEALVHITAEGRCDQFVPLDVDPGFHGWLSAYLATWRVEPAMRHGSAVDCWVVYTARAQMKLSQLESSAFRAANDQSYDPGGSTPQ
jgi:hypothetical protein